MDNLGAPVAYLVLGRDVPVYDPDGQLVGHVAQVLADEQEDIFHGLVISLPGIPDRYRFAVPDQLAGLYERGVTLSVPVERLHDTVRGSRRGRGGWFARHRPAPRLGVAAAKGMTPARRIRTSTNVHPCDAAWRVDILVACVVNVRPAVDCFSGRPR